jgi:hypothetical protein
MIKYKVLVLSIHFLLCGMLPKSNFMFLGQIPAIYSEYQKLNGETNFFEFLEEQFFDNELDLIFTIGLNIAENEEDEHNEAKRIPVPFHFQQTIENTLFSLAMPVFEFLNLDQISINNHFVYKENYIYSFSGNIFHPPKARN